MFLKTQKFILKFQTMVLTQEMLINLKKHYQKIIFITLLKELQLGKIAQKLIISKDQKN